MTRYLVVDDHPLFREAMRNTLIALQADADIYEATSIEGALDVIAAHRDFDLALLDLSLPGTSGFSGLMRMRTSHPKLPIAIVTGHEDPALVREALAMGVAGFIPKSTSKRELAAAIDAILGGSVYVPAQLQGPAADAAPDAERQGMIARLKTLTPQQLHVLDLIRQGLQNKQIAHELGLAETTVKAHVSEILRKLKVYTRTRAVIEMAKIDFAALGGRH